MLIYRSENYPRQRKSFLIMQEYASKPFIAGTAILAAILFVLLSRHYSLLWPGTIGIFFIALVSNYFGIMKTKAEFVEIGFKEQFFYLATVYDIAFKKEIHFYPLDFANASRDGQDIIYLNYQGQIIRLRREHWPELEELWHSFNNLQPELPDNINIA